MTRIPLGAFDKARDSEQKVAIKAVGQKFASFDSRATALTEIRKAVNEYDLTIATLEAELAALKGELKSRPF